MKKRKSLKILKNTVMALTIITVILFIALVVYSRNPYTALDEMDDALETLNLEDVTIYEDRDEIRFTVENPQKNIIFIPGGLVTPDSYKYLAAGIAKEGYNVTIFKTFFNLAILTPNYPKRFISNDLENVVIGHSLGGVVGSMFAGKHKEITQVIMLGSYPIKDLQDKETLMISAEHDLGMDPEAFDDSLKYVNDDNEIFNIIGGNHAQFGWYGHQKGDGEAEISTITQQNLVIVKILDFLNE